MKRLAAMVSAPAAILAAAWVVLALYCFPGFVTLESVDQLVEARTGAITDWNAPVMSLVWRVVEVALSGPLGMLALQTALFGGGLYVLLERVVEPRRAAIFASAITLAPPVLVTLSVVWRDAQLAAWFMAGIALVTAVSPGRRVGGLVMLAIGGAMREHGWVAAVVLAGGLFAWPAGSAGGTRTGRWWSVSIAILAVAGASLALDRVSTRVVTHRAEIARASFDLAGMQRYSRELSELPPGDSYAIVGVRDSYAHQYPGAYLRHREHVLLRQLGLSATPLEPVVVSFTSGSQQREITGFAARHSYVQIGMIAAVRLVMHTPVAWPWVYALGALLTLGYAIRRRDRFAATLVASGLVHELGAALYTTTAEYRTSHWMIVATVVAVVWLRIRSAAVTTAAAASERAPPARSPTPA